MTKISHQNSFLRAALNWLIYQNMQKKFSFWGSLIKISISVQNFSTESAEKSTIYNLLFLVAIYSPKNDNKHPSEMRN